MKELEKVVLQSIQRFLESHLNADDSSRLLNHLRIKGLNIKKVISQSALKEVSQEEQYYINRYFRDIDKESILRKGDIFLASLPESIENDLFRFLTKTNTVKYYHYTSLNAFVNIVRTKRFRFSSIASLNDKSELSYYDQASGYERPQYHYKTIQSYNSRYLLSCSSLEDELNQWRLYGQDGNGICLELIQRDKYSGVLDDSFYIGKILYGDSVIKDLNRMVTSLLEESRILLNLKKLRIWKHFFKAKDWAIENEIRIFNYLPKENDNRTEWGINRFGLLSKYINYDWDDTPIEMSKIILGPKIQETALAIGQTRQLLREKGLGKIEVVKSKINYYR